MNLEEIFEKSMAISISFDLRPPIVIPQGTETFLSKSHKTTKIRFIKELNSFDSWNSGAIVDISYDGVTFTSLEHPIQFRTDKYSKYLPEIQKLMKNIINELNK